MAAVVGKVPGPCDTNSVARPVSNSRSTGTRESSAASQPAGVDVADSTFEHCAHGLVPGWERVSPSRSAVGCVQLASTAWGTVVKQRPNADAGIGGTCLRHDFGM